MAVGGPIQSIQRGLDVLDLLAEAAVGGEARSLQAVAERLGVAPSTAHNIVKTLQGGGYVAKVAGGYALGPRCGDLVRSARLGEVLAATREELHALAAVTGESVVLATLFRGRRQVVARVEGQSLVRVDPRVEAREPERFFELVTGRVLAAWTAPGELAEVVAHHPLSGWPEAGDAAGLTRELAAIRAAGMAEESAAGGEAWAMATPVLGRLGELVAALGIYLPMFRATTEHLATVREAVRDTARRIGERL